MLRMLLGCLNALILPSLSSCSRCWCSTVFFARNQSIAQIALVRQLGKPGTAGFHRVTSMFLFFRDSATRGCISCICAGYGIVFYLTTFSLIGSVSFLAVFNGFIVEDILRDSPTSLVQWTTFSRSNPTRVLAIMLMVFDL
jgi:hypothetical protein